MMAEGETAYLDKTGNPSIILSSWSPVKVLLLDIGHGALQFLIKRLVESLFCMHYAVTRSTAEKRLAE
jgi:hypothetical protein